MIFNLKTKKFVHKEILDLEDNKKRESEDPYKLIQFSADNLYMYLRTHDRKGIKMISLEDGLCT